MTSRRLRSAAAGGAAVLLLVTTLAPLTSAAAPVAAPVGAPAKHGPLDKVPTMSGTGGAVSSVDATATAVGIDVLRRGGNAVDAAVAAAATLGVTEPFSAGPGGGGFFVYYDAKSRDVHAIDGRETAPAAFTETTLTDGSGKARDVDATVSSGLSVGVPGTVATWDEALRRWGTRSLSAAVRPAQQVAERGFVVDGNFRDHVAGNAARFAMFPASARLWLPGGEAPAVGTTFRNPDLARTYGQLRREGAGTFYTGALATDIRATANAPITAPGVTVPGSPMTAADLASYRAIPRQPVRSTYRGHTVYGMPVPSSGGIAVAEILGLMEAYAARTGVPTARASSADYLHRFAEANATAFADRNRWVGDVPGVPTAELVSAGFAAERACGFAAKRAQPRPIPFGSPDGDYGGCGGGTAQAQGREGTSTTHLNAADRWGNVVAYTLTIEQTGGSGITVPGRGFLLNNELTDFDFVPLTPGVPDPNLPGPGKRPRSSMAPTIVLDARGRPLLAAGSPGGATIISTVARVVTGVLDRGESPVAAIAAPRISSRNTATTAEPALLASPEGRALLAKGHDIEPVDSIGNASAIQVLLDARFEAAAETSRGGGGSARVVHPDRNR